MEQTTITNPATVETTERPADWLVTQNRDFASTHGFDHTQKPQENAELQQTKLNSIIEKGAEKVSPLLQRFERDGNLLKDFVAPIGRNGDVENMVRFSANGGVNLLLPAGVIDSQPDKYSLHRNAIQQLSDKLGIHGSYVRTLIDSTEGWKNELIAHTLNQFASHSKRDRILLRSVMGQVRGVLSTKYRRYDSVKLLETFIRQSQAMGMSMVDGYYNDIKVNLEAVHKQVFVVDTPNNGRMVFAFGVRVKDSAFGVSKYEVQCLMIQVWCYNMQTTQSVLSQVHLGKELPSNIEFADDTMKLQTQALEHETRDILATVMSPAFLTERIEEIKKASSQEVDLNAEFQRLFSSGKMLKNEVEMLKSVISANRPEDGIAGGNTLLKLTQGIGRVAQDVDAERQRELNDFAHSLMTRN